MTQGHMDRLTAIDASFLTNESDSSHMHVGAVLIFEGPPPGYDDFLEHVRSRLHLVPRFRQKLAFPPIETGRPFWVDDPNFNLAYHVRHSALPSPGSEEQLRNIAGRLFSQRLDRSKPLWELWLVQGLERNRFALINKTHHALVDGVSGVDIATVLFDLKPVPESIEPDEAWVPSPPPSPAEMAARGVKEMGESPLKLGGRAMRAGLHPLRTARRATEYAQALGEVAWNFTNPAPELPLNVHIGSHRRFAWTRCRLEDFKLIKDSLGGTVNDVVLTVVSGAVRAFFERRGFAMDVMDFRVAVPVNIRADAERHFTGNRVSAWLVSLPIQERRPTRRLLAVQQMSRHLKETNHAIGGRILTQAAEWTSTNVLTLGALLSSRVQPFNLIVTNVPGPQFPLYLLGARMEAIYPQVPLFENQALGIALFSYNGKLFWGFNGDWDALPDLEVFVKDSEASFRALRRAAQRQRAAATASPARRRPPKPESPPVLRPVANSRW
jgi:diacylglycerol O-acyltransferase